MASIVASEKGLKSAQMLLRHSNLSTTADVYVHVSKEETREGVEDKLSKLCPIVAPSEALGSDIVQ